MTLQEILSYFFNNYKNFIYQRKNVPFKNNKVVSTINHLNNKITNIPYLNNDASIGDGGWSMTPWLIFYNSNYPFSPEQGIYLVYLFSDDMKSVYLSLNRGVTKFKKYNNMTKDDSLKSSSHYARQKITELEKKKIKDNKLNTKYYIKNNQHIIINIHLNKFEIPTTARTKEYEEANIFSIKYKRADIVTDSNNTDKLIKINDKLINDLKYMNGLYNELIPFAKELNAPKATTNHRLKGRIIRQVNPPTSSNTHPKHGHRRKTSPRAHNYLHIHKNNMSTGDYGEAIILKVEQLRYKSDPNIKIEHTSKKYHDHKNYDIGIFNLNKSTQEPIKKIEVKSTTSRYKKTKFPITKNEVSCLVNDPNKYELARVYNLNDNNNKSINYFFISGTKLLNNLLFTPSSYTVSFNKPYNDEKNYVIRFAKK